MASNNKVCVDIDQTDPEHGGFTDAEKQQARSNIGVDLEMHESILDYADDWVDISSEFSLASGVSVYTGAMVTGVVADLKILFSKKLRIIYFNNPDCRLVTNSPLDLNWRSLLFYNGNRFLTVATGASLNPKLSDYRYPTDVMAAPLLTLLCINAGSTSEYGMLNWVGTTSADCCMAVKRVFSASQNSTGVYSNHCVFKVELPPDNI